MDKMTFEDSEKTFKDLEKITNKDANARLKIFLYRNNKRISNNNTNENNLEYENPNEQEILNEFSIEDVKKIPNSNFGLIEVDRAGARSRWFFVEIKDNILSFISEIPDTSPDISVLVDEDGSIKLICKDINGNIKKYKSIDSGKTFVPFN